MKSQLRDAIANRMMISKIVIHQPAHANLYTRSNRPI